MNTRVRMQYEPTRKTWVLPVLLLFSWGMSCQAGDNEYGIKASLPPAVQSRLVARFQEIARGTYPLADKSWIDGVLAAKFPKDQCGFRMYMTGCEIDDWFNAKSGLKTSWNMTSGLEMVGSDNPLPGEPASADREKPLTIDEGKPIAEAVFNRLKDLMMLGKEMKFTGQTPPDLRLPYSEDRAVWIYTWSASDKFGLGSTVAITIRARDGRMVAIRMRPSYSEGLPEIKVTREQALEKAKVLPEKLNEKYLSLSVRYYYAERRLVWQYMPPPVPMGRSINFGVWDAMTGELLESDSFNGGTRYKPWRNPEFFFEPTEANVKANLEKNLKKWAEELESKVKAASPATEVKQSDSK